MQVLSPEKIAKVVEKAILHLACEMQDDIVSGLEAARASETHPLGQEVLEQLLQNQGIARRDTVPICQDTGTVWVCLEAGEDVLIPGNIFSCVDEAVARVYKRACLRMSVVHDALLDRSNTQDNTPAFCEIRLTKDPGARIHIMLKGGGSDNASRVCMLNPSSGKQGIIDEVLSCVKEKGANACPPLVIGIGVGSTFDAVSGLAKKALMRQIDDPTSDPALAAFEHELLDAVNATGIGPGGLGGKTTAIGVRVITAPCHIAALPLAINMGCCALRRTTVRLDEDEDVL